MTVTTAAAALAAESLTENGRKFMTLVGERFFDFFDGGIVEHSGNWGENMAYQMTGKVGNSKRSNGGIMGATLKAGMWTATEQEDGMWWSLTEVGAAVANYLAGSGCTCDGLHNGTECTCGTPAEVAPVAVQSDSGLVTAKVGRKWTYLYVGGVLIAEVLNEQAAAVQAYLQANR